jgi:hypothetical protein
MSDEMQYIEVIGILRVLSIFIFVPISGLMYFSENKKLGRIFGSFLFIFFIVELFLTRDYLTYSLILITFISIPLILSPFIFLTKYISLRKTEMRHGNSGLTLKLEPFEVYNIF